MRAATGDTAWRRGRFDGRPGKSRLLFGRMHEDCAIESRAFAPGGRVFCIASAGCTAIELSRRHEVVAVDVNPVQVAYVKSRTEGALPSRGLAERLMDFGRSLGPLVGWRRSRIDDFLDLDDPAEQVAYWRQHLDTLRFRAAMNLALSKAILSTLYVNDFLRCVPGDFGDVMRRRMERCFARHANRRNPYARELLLGEPRLQPAPAENERIRIVHSDAAAFLENEPAGAFNGFALSNVFDGARAEYKHRLTAAVRRAAAPGAVAVLRSFSEPHAASDAGLAGEDRSMLWGIVEARPAVSL